MSRRVAAWRCSKGTGSERCEGPSYWPQRGSIEKVYNNIIAAKGKAEMAIVDAMNEELINIHLKQVGKIDISFNAIGIDVQQNVPLIEMKSDDYINPVTLILRTQFLTATAAGRVMKMQGSGVILTLTATPGGIGYPYTGGFSPACCAVENLTKNLASELGIYGVRVINIRSGGSPDSKTFKTLIDNHPDEMNVVLGKMKYDTMLKRLPSMSDIANTAVFLTSDLASTITGVSIDVTCGTTVALNHRVISS